MANSPFFSVVVCTRNRPDVLQPTILALQNQSFQDFEVILSDNSDPEIKEQNRCFIEQLNFKQLKYVMPERVLNMHDNYNFALDHTTGKYVGGLTDKNLLKREALKELHTFLKENPVDIMTYKHGGCCWYPEKFFKWFLYTREAREERLAFYDPKEELRRRFALEKSIYHEGLVYNFGKIFFGFYSRKLIEKMQKKYQDVFHGCASDYTSLALALQEAEKAVFCPQELMLAVNNYAGNGMKVATLPGAYMNFIKGCTDNIEKLLSDCPIPNVYTFHNLCAYDYQILNRFGCDDYQINLPNLAQRVYEDLQTFPFADEAEKETLWRHFNAFVQQHNLKLDQQKAQELKDYLTPKPKLSSWEKCQAFMRSKNKLRIIYNILYNLLTTRYISLYSILK